MALGVEGLGKTVTEEDAALMHFPVAVAVAVITFPPASAGDIPVFVHPPLETVVVPNEAPPLKTSMMVPSSSELVPLIEVAPAHIVVVVITGAAVVAVHGLRAISMAPFAS